MSEGDARPVKKKSETTPPRRRPKKIIIPRRTQSIFIPEKKIVYITADKTTCEACPCYPKEDLYRKPKKFNPCQKSPVTLYELAANAVEELNFPKAFRWSEEDVTAWMADVVGLPQYKQASILENHINGLRLLMLEDPSQLPAINIHNFKHIQMITSKVHEEFSTEFIKFARSIGLPPRKPLTHTTWFKSKTGPSWGIRVNWTRCDILRWMKIIMPAPVYINHWDLVWYQKPDFPKTMFARIPNAISQVHMPQYKRKEELCKEYLVPRKFRFQSGIPETSQMIWMEHRPDSPDKNIKKEKKKKEKRKIETCVPKDSRLVPKRISLTGLAGDDLLLARRQMPKQKFFA